jgi:hypothetical protein
MFERNAETLFSLWRSLAARISRRGTIWWFGRAGAICWKTSQAATLAVNRPAKRYRMAPGPHLGGPDAFA